MLTAYRRAFALPGAWQFSSTAFVGRLPIAMIGLGIVLLISQTTGSYAVAGALGAAFQIAAAVGAVVTSRWTDRLGQHRLLPGLSVVHGLLLVAFVAAVHYDTPVLVQAAVVALAGFFQPAIGSMVRARWAKVAEQTDLLSSAFAIESILDELIFTIGPMLTAFLAFTYGLSVPLVAAAILTVVGSLLLARQRRTEPPPHERSSSGARETRTSAIRRPGMTIVAVASMGVGAVFGTYEVTVVAFTQEAGQTGASGVVLGLWALGSFLGGLIFGSRQWRLDLPAQVVALTGILTAALLVAPFVRSVVLLCVTAFLAAMVVAPSLIAIFSLTERLVPSDQLTEGLTWTNSGLALGFSIGTAVNGMVIDARGTTVAFMLPAVCSGLACLVAALGASTLGRASAGHRSGNPASPLNVDPVAGPAPGGIMDDPPPRRSETR